MLLQGDRGPPSDSEPRWIVVLRVHQVLFILGVTVAPLKRFLAVDFVRRGFGFRHLFLGNNSFFRRGYLGRRPPQLPHAKKGIISEKLVAKNETASDAFLNLNRPFSAVSKPPPA
eukprot:COSAG06_NODE_1815_length_8303_cov_3.031936_1_plen_114_part_10